MSGMALWQRVLYHAGEVLMVAGLAWALWRVVILRTCPVGPVNDITLIVGGLALSVLPVMPLPGSGGHLAAYITPVLRTRPMLAWAAWVVAFGCGALALYARLTLKPGLLWFYALIPVLLYLWFGTASRLAGGRGKGARNA
jgi:hypothetical protein